MKRSLRFKVFRINIISVAAAVIVFMIFGIGQVRRFANIMEQGNHEQNNVIMNTMQDTMEDIATEDFQKYVVSEAKVLDGQFTAMKHDLEVLARQVPETKRDSCACSCFFLRTPTARIRT